MGVTTSRARFGIVTGIALVAVLAAVAAARVEADLRYAKAEKIEQAISGGERAINAAEQAKSAAERAKQLIPGKSETGQNVTPQAAQPAATAQQPASPPAPAPTSSQPAGAAPAAAPTPAAPAPAPGAPTTAPAAPAAPANVYARIDQITATPAEWPAVKLYVSVFDLQGRSVKGLQAGDFVVDEGGAAAKPVDVKSFAESREGMAVLLVLDASGSMRGPPFRDAKRGVNSFLSVLGPGDQAGLMVLHDQVQLPISYTTKIEDVKAKVDETEATAKITLLYDGLIKAIEEVAARAAALPARRVIVVMSDGRDEGSTKKLEDVRDAALAANVPIYSVGFTRVGPQYLPNLRRLSELTGGAYFDARASAQLSEIYARLFEHLKSLYVVTHRVTAIKPDGQSHPLSVRVTVQGAEAAAPRRSFLAPLVAVAVPPTATPVEVVKPPRRLWWPIVLAAIIALLVVAVIAVVLWRRRGAPAPVVRTCAGCGQAVQPDWVECRYCNTKVPPEPVFGRLIVSSGPGKGSTFALSSSLNTIGLGEENQIALKAAGVAPQHAGIAVSNKQYELTDYGSETGTYVNGVRVTQRFLKNQDVLRIGAVELVFEMARR